MQIKMSWQIGIIAIYISLIAFSCRSHYQTDADWANRLERTPVSVDEMVNWSCYGQGRVFNEGHGQLCLTEADTSKGVMLISPEKYQGDVVIKYKTLTLTPATVLVVMLAATNAGESQMLSIPEDYDGSMEYLMKEVDSYFYAFRNEAHNYTPFVRRYPEPGGVALASAPANVMEAGKFYEIEVGKTGNQLWLAIDGKELFRAIDKNTLQGGYISFRIRGTAGFKAACLIKDVEIYHQ